MAKRAARKTASELLRELRAGHPPDLGCAYGAHDWKFNGGLMTCESCGGVYTIPHRWDGFSWHCLKCGEVHGDPCTCPCHDLT